jgi:hypothetical protein
VAAEFGLFGGEVRALVKALADLGEVLVPEVSGDR